MTFMIFQNTTRQMMECLFQMDFYPKLYLTLYAQSDIFYSVLKIIPSLMNHIIYSLFCHLVLSILNSRYL